MANPTIIIGIGTSGLKVLENVQRFHYESFGTNKPDHVEYLYIETSEDSSISATFEDNEIQKVILSLKEIRSMSAYVKSLGATWVPPLDELSTGTVGAGGIRPNGRIGFWGKNKDKKNYIDVKTKIKFLVSKVTSHKNDTITDKSPVFFVTGSFTGGTGSGIFIDLAYLIRNAVKNLKDLHGLFLIPPIPNDLDENAQYYANTYGAISDLNHYNLSDTHYKESLPDSEDIDTTDQPFDLTQLISQNYMKGDSAISSIDGLYKMAGLYLFLNLIGVREHRMARLIDSPIGKYGTFGMSGIQYPKDQIQEFIACELSKQLVQSWINKKQYFVGGNERVINRNEISFTINEKWDQLLQDVFKGLDAIKLEDNLAKMQLAALAKEIRAGNIADHKKVLSEKFRSRSSNNYYISVSDNLQTSTNTLIDGIYEINKGILEDTENIQYAKTSLETLSTTIGDTLKFWNSLGINAKSDKWDSLLVDLINEIDRSAYWVIGENENLIHDKLTNIFDLLKMHLLGKKLKEIMDNMSDSKMPLVSSSKVSRKLPKIDFYNGLSDKLNNLTQKDQPISFEKRKNDILADINDGTLPIIRVFQFGGFDRDTKNALDTYISNNPAVSKKDIIGSESLWEYLLGIEQIYFVSTLYKTAIKSYKQIIRNSNVVQDYDVTNYIKENLDNSVVMAKKATNVFLPIKDGVTLDKAHHLPRFVAASRRGAIEEVLGLFKNKKSFDDFNADEAKTFLEIPQLQNIMVFYDEKAGLVPLEMISYADQMKKVYDKKPRSVADITEEEWKIRTRAYVPEFKTQN